MANLSAYKRYATQTTESENEFAFDLETLKQIEGSSEEEVSSNTIDFSEQKPNLTEKENSVSVKPAINEDDYSLRSYRLPSEVIDALEEHFFKNRKNFGTKFSYSKYVANLIWKDTHGVDYFDNAGQKI